MLHGTSTGRLEISRRIWMHTVRVIVFIRLHGGILGGAEWSGERGEVSSVGRLEVMC